MRDGSGIPVTHRDGSGMPVTHSHIKGSWLKGQWFNIGKWQLRETKLQRFQSAINLTVIK